MLPDTYDEEKISQSCLPREKEFTDKLVAQTSLEALNKLLHSTSVTTIKAVIPIFSTIYPILFKLL